LSASKYKSPPPELIPKSANVLELFWPVLISNKLDQNSALVEFGPGDMSKIRYLLKDIKPKKYIGIDISKEEVYKLYLKQGGKCALSGVEMTHIRTHDVEGDTNISIDRIDPEGLYDIENIQLVCKRVNFMKHNNNQKNFLNWVGLIYNNTNNE